jgi:hypothetical protein
MAFTFTLNKLRYKAKLVKYDEKLNIVKEVELSRGDRVYGPFIPFLKNINNKIFLFYHQPSDNENEIGLYASELNETTLEQKAPKKILAIDQKNIGLFKAWDLFSNQKLIFNSLPNYQKTILAWSGGVNNEIYISVVDQNIDLLWTKHETVANAGEIILSNACIDKNGAVYISYVNKKDKRNFIYITKQQAPSINMELLIDGGNARHSFVSLLDKDIMIAGTYTENNGDYLTGAFSQRLSTNDLKFSNQRKYPFSEFVVQQFKNESYASIKNKSYGIFGNSDFEHVVMEDGVVSLSADLNRYRSGSGVSPAGINTSHDIQITGSILHILITKDSAVFSRIGKSDVTVSPALDPPNLFFPFAYKDKMLFLYNDHQQFVDGSNEKTTRDDNPYSQLIVATLDKNGTVARKELRDITFKYDKLGLAIEKIKLITNSLLMLPTLNNRMGILKIEN